VIGIVAASASILSGCIRTREFVVREPVGPVEGVKESAGTEGNLVVYSGWDRLGTLDSEHRKHTSYTIHAAQEERTIRVWNRMGSFGGEPEMVRLSPGRYWIEAGGTNVGEVRIPVVVRGGETTVVYLDGTTEPDAPWRLGTNWIRQPNGLILGWRDAANEARLGVASESK
jgi:hypothetical protein